MAIAGKTILITGGTGSFGGVLLRNVLELKAKEVIVFSRDEKKQFDMRDIYHGQPVRFIIGDIRDRGAVDQAIRGVDLVFHAAALKHVPTGELFPLELVKTNILGSANVIESAIKHGVGRVIVLSTDKAVYPINTMGMSKALVEKLMISYALGVGNGSVVCGVRYGNVMNSRGSVIPIFIDQIKRGKPLTVTNKNMTRFMLPLPDSIDLALYALTRGEPGDLFVRKSPACTIGTLVEALSLLFSYGGGVKEIGTRAGEKLHETLVSREELARAEDLGNYFKIIPEIKIGERAAVFAGFNQSFIEEGGYTSANAKILTVEELVVLLKNLPEISEALVDYEYSRYRQSGVHR